MNLKNITPLQWVGIIILFNTTLIGGTSQLADLFISAAAVKAVTAVAVLGNGFLGGLVTMFAGPAGMAKQLSNTTGVDPIHINANASQSLAAAAVDPANRNIGPAPGATAAVQAIAKGAAAVLLVLGSLAFASGDVHAQSLRKPQLTGDIAADTKANLGLGGQSTPVSKGLNDILGALDDKLLPDLMYAKKMADATGSVVTAPCYQSWIDLINKRKTAVTNADGTPMDLPNPRLVTDFEKAVELRNALQPESDFMIKCSPVANMIKQDMISFIGKILAGGAGLATLVPGL